MRSLVIGLAAAVTLAIVSPVYAAVDGVYSTKYLPDKTQVSKRTHKAVIGHRARASYAHVPRHRHGRGSYSVGNDPIRRAMDDPYMYGRPDRH